MDTLMVAMPKSSWVLGKGGKMLRVLNRPSWLMRGKEVLGKFVRVFYEEVEWVDGVGLHLVAGKPAISNSPLWGPSELCMSRFIACNGMLMGMWVNIGIIYKMLAKHYPNTF